MGDNNEEVSLTHVVVSQPTVAQQNELFMQLMQQIAGEGGNAIDTESAST